MIISILEPLPTHNVTSPLTSPCSFCNSRFELLLFSNWTSIKYRGVATNTSKIHINNLYIKYTFVHFAILLIRQILGAVPLPVTSPFAVEALSLRLRSRLGLLHLSSNFAFRSSWSSPSSLCPFLETSGLVNHQHLMLFLDFYLRRSQHREELGNYFRHPLHTIVHHEVLLTWWWWLENSINHYLIWKINSHLIQAIVVPRQSEHMLTSWAILLHLLAIELVGDFISLNLGICLKY